MDTPYYFIVNPTSSSGNGLVLWKHLEKWLKKEPIEYKAYMPVDRAQASELTAALTKSLTHDIHLIVVGGDGTLNAVLQGIRDFSHTILSCVRTGSGNDFARNMGLEKNPLKNLLSILYAPTEYLLDYGVVSFEPSGPLPKAAPSRRFLISSGLGYDADICDRVGKSRMKRILNQVHLGKLVYLFTGIRLIFTRRCTGAVLQMDNSAPLKVRELFFVVSMIHAKEGGGVPFCPHADPTDQLLDVCLVQNMPVWKLLPAVVLVYLKQHFLFQKVTEHRCKKLRIHTKRPLWFHFDGETICRAQTLCFECRQGLRFVK